MMTESVSRTQGAELSGEEKLARMEEVVWVTQAKLNDSDAFGRLMARYERPLFYFLRKLVPEGESALDLHQEVWVDVWRGLQALQAPEAFRVWIYKIARHKAARYRRNEFREQLFTESLAENIPGEEMQEEEPVFDAESLHAGLATLPLKQREILTLHYLKDLSIDEIGEVLECPAGTVKSRLYHARKALRRLLEKRNL
ncbi:MAG: rpoE 12 [Verrucomicrobiales bacterium]|nr:rpoE 12 [Verrucomicrobiales bacterium]